MYYCIWSFSQNLHKQNTLCLIFDCDVSPPRKHFYNIFLGCVFWDDAFCWLPHKARISTGRKLTHRCKHVSQLFFYSPPSTVKQKCHKSIWNEIWWSSGFIFSQFTYSLWSLFNWTWSWYTGKNWKKTPTKIFLNSSVSHSSFSFYGNLLPPSGWVFNCPSCHCGMDEWRQIIRIN